MLLHSYAALIACFGCCLKSVRPATYYTRSTLLSAALYTGVILKAALHLGFDTRSFKHAAWDKTTLCYAACSATKQRRCPHTIVCNTRRCFADAVSACAADCIMLFSQQKFCKSWRQQAQPPLEHLPAAAG
jgi:hypothetical protein